MSNVLLEMPWRRLIKVGKPFWVSKEARIAFLHLASILTLLAAKAFVAVFINRTAGHFMTAIEQKVLADLHLYLALSILAVVVIVPIEVYCGMLRTRLALIWRRSLSKSLIDQYFVERFGLHIEKLHEIDNPEQRLTQDADSFCNSLLGLFLSILDAVITVGTFISVLWDISPTLSVTVMIYASLGLVIVARIGRSLVGLSSQHITQEADLRVGLGKAREELVGTRDPNEPSLIAQAGDWLNAVISTWMEIMVVNKNIQLFTTHFNLLMPLIPAVIIAPSYFAGQIPFGTITQAVMAFTSVFHGATVLINQFSGISTFAAITNRLGSLIEGLEAGRRDLVELDSKSTDDAAVIQ